MALPTAISDGESGASVRTKLNTLIAGYVKHNMAASADPTVNDDSSADYAAGSVWLRVATGDMWRCRSASVGAAKWVKLDVSDHPGYVAGRWYLSALGQVAGGAVLVANSIRLHPFVIKQRITISDLGSRVNTLAASGNVQLAIYASDPATKLPTGNAVAATGNISTTTAGVVSADIAGADVSLEPGVYWAAINADGTAAGVAIMQAFAASSVSTAQMIGSALQASISSSGGNAGLILTVSQTFGTWPDLTAASFVEANSIAYGVLHFKVASVP